MIRQVSAPQKNLTFHFTFNFSSALMLHTQNPSPYELYSKSHHNSVSASWIMSSIAFPYEMGFAVAAAGCSSWSQVDSHFVLVMEMMCHAFLLMDILQK